MYYTVLLLGGAGILKCMDPPKIENKTYNSAAKLLLASVISDALISITALVIGILGITGVIPGIPPAASYSLLGLGGIVALAWLSCSILSAITKGNLLTDVKTLLLGNDSRLPNT